MPDIWHIRARRELRFTRDMSSGSSFAHVRLLRRARTARRRCSFALIPCVAFLVSTPAAAFRTTADEPDFDGYAAKWDSESISLEVVVAAGLSDDLTRAVGAWADAGQSAACGGPQLSGVLSDRCTSEHCVSLGDGHNSVVVSRDEARFDEGTAAVTELSYRERHDRDGWLIVEADIWLNGPLIERRVLNRRRVLAHELGHLLGLLHPSCGSTDPLCTRVAMADWPLLHPLYTEATVTTPTADDVAGLCFLYPACAATCGEGDHCQDGSCVADCLCPDGSRCGASGCAEADGHHGDACTTNRECLTGLCALSGHCAERCDGGRCGDRHTCAGGLCESSLGAFGTACAAGSDCITGVCLTREGRSICTRDCAGGCPSTSDCAPVDGREVCVPEASGCSTGGGASGWWVAIGLLGAIRSRWRRVSR